MPVRSSHHVCIVLCGMVPPPMRLASSARVSAISPLRAADLCTYTHRDTACPEYLGMLLRDGPVGATEASKPGSQPAPVSSSVPSVMDDACILCRGRSQQSIGDLSRLQGLACSAIPTTEWGRHPDLCFCRHSYLLLPLRLEANSPPLVSHTSKDNLLALQSLRMDARPARPSGTIDKAIEWTQAYKRVSVRQWLTIPTIVRMPPALVTARAANVGIRH